MANTNLLREIIETVYYNNAVQCGPGNQYLQLFEGSSEILGIPYLVPQQTYRPTTYVSFDFTHTFVETIDNAKNPVTDDEKRLVPKERLIQYAEKMAVNMVAFFDSVSVVHQRNGDNYYDMFGASRFIHSGTFDETTANEFINTVINFFLTSVQVNRNRREIGTTNVVFKDNKNIRGAPGCLPFRLLFANDMSILSQLFVPMIPMKVWSRGRFYREFFFPIFDGYITNVTPTDNQGFVELQLIGKDVLELARISNEMINPALIQQAELKNIQTINFQAMPFYNHKHTDIVKTIFMGGILEFDPPIVPEEGAQGTAVAEAANKAKANAASIRSITTKFGDPEGMNFTKLDNFELLSNADSNFKSKVTKVLDQRAVPVDEFSIREMVRRTSHKKYLRKLVLWGSDITPYRIFGLQSPDIFSSDFSSRLDVLNEVAEMIYHDFYVDGDGNVHFHPQRLANTFLKNDIICMTKETTRNDTTVNTPYNGSNIWPGVNVFGPDELTMCSTTLNVDALITHLKLVGQDPSGVPDSELLGIVGKATHRGYMNKFGYRRQKEDCALLNTQYSASRSGMNFCNLMAVCILLYRNSELYTKEATCIHRPELDIARPIFFTEDRTVFYLNSVTHSINVGGDATTTLNSSFGRKYQEVAPDLFNFLVTSEQLAVYNTIKESDVAALIDTLPLDTWNTYLEEEDQILPGNSSLQKFLDDSVTNEQARRSAGR